MTESIIVAVITGVLSLAGTVITVLVSSRNTAQEIRINQAVTDTKLDALTREAGRKKLEE